MSSWNTCAGLSPDALPCSLQFALDLLEDQARPAAVLLVVEGADANAHAGHIARVARDADLEIVELELAEIGGVLGILRHGVLQVPQGVDGRLPRLVEVRLEVPLGLVLLVVDVAEDAGRTRGSDDGQAAAGERYETEDRDQAEFAHGSFLSRGRATHGRAPCHATGSE